ncbi:chorismate mutase [Fonticella tunisiensis]|uniref:chorismate mutase n=1 Tax=Fonticella tunisiensis TaxID=1096341 RepID=A0A4R7KUR7_9CLOT|nr:chorismate mutase [Fonticella tunisiensis]TDT61880.1 chorismate mutase [Fonticella tunisiensis]
MFSIRGAITVDRDEKEEIIKSSEELLLKIINSNGISIGDIISVIFTCTKDLCSAYPAVGARNIGITKAGIMCLQEMYVENSLEKCIRVMLLVNGDKNQSDVKHIYLKKAVSLRPDLMEEF